MSNVYRITSNFLDKESIRNIPHNGIDFAMQSGEELKAIQNGVIRIVDHADKLSGKTVLIDTLDGKTLVYGHLSDFAVKSGDIVKAGDLIGYAGSTGFSTGSHLHFAINENGKFIDPSSYIIDIQNMNTPNYFVQQATEIKLTFIDFFQQHMNLLTDQIINVKVNFIHFIVSSDYSPIIKLLQNVIQFIFFNI